ncbi:MORC family CW-type zinc finger protein 3 [Merluccius polli]|uniref:MORC family CW-type zinc finger protein 3 n=1 Tax=Merluccius polli TaxID=89951 RepID=A0AA47N423_MERPO|nr:MORC family CW-type zinc finger protein 3 [Merluccius polli]
MATRQLPRKHHSQDNRHHKRFLSVYEQQSSCNNECILTVKNPLKVRLPYSPQCLFDSHFIFENLIFTQIFLTSLMKRRQPTTPQSESKRPKLNGVRRTLDMYTRPISLTSSPLTPAPREDANNEDDSGSRTASELSATGNDATEQTSDISTAYNDGAQVREEGSDITQAQEQQNQLLEHLQSVSYERDALTDKVTRLLTQLTEVEERQRADCEKEEANKSLYEQAREKAEELTREKEALLEASQAHAGVLQQNQQMAKQIEDFKCQLNQSSNEKEKLCLEVKRLEEEKAREKAEELTREKEALLEASQAHARVLQQNQQMAKQIEDFKCQLNQSSNEKEKLCLEVKRLEEEKASISAECEQIRITMEEQATFRERDATTQTCARGPQIKEEAGEAAESSTATSYLLDYLSVSHQLWNSLVELRHNVARLLLRYVPLELDQVNYECNVIDEILEQYLCSVLSSNSSTSH